MQTLQQLISGELAGSTHLKLSCNLTEFPEQIFHLAETLEILDLSRNHLSTLPSNLGLLTKLKIIFCSENNFTELPEVLSQCKHLDIIGFKANKISYISENALPLDIRWLILTDNCLAAIPKSIGKCHRLQKLMLAGNQLTTLPLELSNCNNLGLLRISMNNIQTLPDWLLLMPKLSWLAYAGNPCHVSPVTKNTLLEIPWHHLQLSQELGQGASGIISKAIWKQEETSKPPTEVAVKIFKGNVTSDGMPADEMDVCMAAGKHPHLVEVLGKIVDHPTLKEGLVLGLIPPTYKNLGQPPSFVTCTRDVFAQGTSFSLSKVVQLSVGIATAAAHLHQRGIMHGDLYAHNILSNQEDHPLLGDFGAATSYNRSNKTLSPLLERLEVSAFGHLLDDLLRHLETPETGYTIIYKLKQLQQACINPTVLERPDFESITSILEQARAELSSYL